MKSVVELSADDFPGVNPEKFHEWKTAALRIRRNWQLFFGLLLCLTALLVPLAGRNVVGAGLLPLALLVLANRKPAEVVQKLGAELGLDAQSLKDARRGVVPTRFRGVAL